MLDVRYIVVCLIVLLACFTGTGAPEYRGVNAYLELLNEGDIRTLAVDWNVNLIRLCLGMLYHGGAFTFEDGEDIELEAPDLDLLDRCLDWCGEYGIRVILDLHQFPGYIVLSESGEADLRIWSNFHYHNLLISFWRQLAAHCSDRGDVIYGYDLLNEPRPSSQLLGTPSDWNLLASRITSAIRSVDADHAIIIGCAEVGNPRGFRQLVPTGDSNTIYSFHMWLPHFFTHQAVGPSKWTTDWPAIGGIWSKEWLRSEIEPVLEFQRRHNVRVLVGEFGVSTWAPAQSRAAYLRDCMDLFEEYGFDYCYWSFREWQCWSLEHVPYQAEWGLFSEYVGDTTALLTMKEYFDLNEPHATAPTSFLPVCVFDETHWLPGQDINVMNRELGWRLSGLCQVQWHSLGPIDAALLEDAKLLVTGALREPLSPTEETAILDFVRAGGALLFYGDLGSLPAEGLLAPLGISFDPTAILAFDPDWDAASFWIEGKERTHPITRSEWSFHTNWGGSVAAVEPAFVVASTHPETWRDANGNRRQDGSEETGPFGLLAIAEVGSGRVAVLADNPFNLAYNWALISQAVMWLLAAG